MKKLISIALIMILLMGASHFLVDEDVPSTVNNQDDLEVHFIDVGQGDAILIKKGMESMLIDGGDNGKGNIVVDYLKEEKIDKLNYIIATHPHADHIGGLQDVLKEFDVEKIIMPDAINNTKTFENLLDIIMEKGMEVTKAKSGDRYELNGASFLILAPNKEKYTDLNDYSVVVKMTNGSNSYLFTGDAEEVSEKEILEVYNNRIKADVLKLGHHGSITSTSEEFLKAVNPEYGVITVGLDNRYNHPDDEVLERLEQRDVKVYRTDLHGTVISISDGEKIRFKTTKD